MKRLGVSLLLLAGVLFGALHVMAAPTPWTFTIISPPQQTIVSALVNGGTTGSFVAPAGTGTSAGTLSATCSNTCSGVTFALATVSPCDATSGAGNANFTVSGTALDVNSGTAAGTFAVCVIAFSQPGGQYKNTVAGKFTITGTQAPTITSVLLNGGTTSSFPAPAGTGATLAHCRRRAATPAAASPSHSARRRLARRAVAPITEASQWRAPRLTWTLARLPAPMRSAWSLLAPVIATQLRACLPSPASVAGCLPGSLCPPGNWVNDLDEHFTGSSLPSNWAALTNNALGAGGESNCQTPGAMVFNHPGLTLFGLPFDFTNNLVNGCIITTPPDYHFGLSTPGYFEAKIQLDSSLQTWDGVFFEFGTNGSCLGDIAQNGTEADLAETIVTYFGLHWNGYAQCATGGGGGYNQTVAGSSHIWGLDYGDNGALTFYVDGVQQFQQAPADGVEPPGGICPSGSIRCSGGLWEGQMIFMDFQCLEFACTNTDSGGMTIFWARHYHH